MGHSTLEMQKRWSDRLSRGFFRATVARSSRTATVLLKLLRLGLILAGPAHRFRFCFFSDAEQRIFALRIGRPSARVARMGRLCGRVWSPYIGEAGPAESITRDRKPSLLRAAGATAAPSPARVFAAAPGPARSLPTRR
jgi:hypothetical protein